VIHPFFAFPLLFPNKRGWISIWTVFGGPGGGDLYSGMEREGGPLVGGVKAHRTEPPPLCVTVLQGSEMVLGSGAKDGLDRGFEMETAEWVGRGDDLTPAYDAPRLDKLPFRSCGCGGLGMGMGMGQCRAEGGAPGPRACSSGGRSPTSPSRAFSSAFSSASAAD